MWWCGSAGCLFRSFVPLSHGKPEQLQWGNWDLHQQYHYVQGAPWRLLGTGKKFGFNMHCHDQSHPYPGPGLPIPPLRSVPYPVPSHVLGLPAFYLFFYLSHLLNGHTQIYTSYFTRVNLLDHRDVLGLGQNQALVRTDPHLTWTYLWSDLFPAITLPAPTASLQLAAVSTGLNGWHAIGSEQ